MSFHVTDRYGQDEDEDVCPARMRELLVSLGAPDDDEHADVSLTHESEWSLGVFPGGLVVWENVAGDGDPKHMVGVSLERTLGLWQKLAAGQITEVDAEPWLPGYGPS